MNKLIAIVIATAVVVGGGAFFGGMKYAESKSPRGRLSQTDFQSLQNLSPEERQQRLQDLGANIGAGFRGGTGGGQRSGGGFTAGEIIAKNDSEEPSQGGTGKNITVKISDGQGGSKIIFFSDATKIAKSVAGSPADLSIGEQVSVSGTPNQDGSITAQSIQIRPDLPQSNRQ